MLLRDHPGWRGAPSSLESTEPSLSFDQLTHEIGPVSTLLEERADDCSDPWSLPITGGRNLVGFKRKTFFLLSIFFSFSHFLSLCQGKLVPTNATGRLEMEPSFLEHFVPKWILAPNPYPTLSQVWTPVKALENRNTDQTHLQCAVTLHCKSMCHKLVTTTSS